MKNNDDTPFEAEMRREDNYNRLLARVTELESDVKTLGFALERAEGTIGRLSKSGISKKKILKLVKALL